MSSTANKITFLNKARAGQLTIAVIFILIVLWILSSPDDDLAEQVAQTPLLKVSTLTVQPNDYRVSTTVVGNTQPRWQLDIISAVEGRVRTFSDQLEPGELVTSKTLLVGIEDAAYVANVANMQAGIKQAELELARIKHERTVVEQISSDNKLTDFGRFEPHLASAQADLEAAKSAKLNAQQRLDETRFYAPFDAIILDKQVVPGQWINVGDRLFTLAASDSIDVYAELSTEQQQKVGRINAQTSIVVRDQNNTIWPAKLRYVAPAYSSQTRQQQIVFYVEQPFSEATRLSPNAMVNVTIQGEELSNVVSVPSSVLTPDGQVWVVVDNRLVKETVSIEEEFDDRIYLRFNETPSNPREIVRFPLSTMLPDQQVEASPMQIKTDPQHGQGGSSE